MFGQNFKGEKNLRWRGEIGGRKHYQSPYDGFVTFANKDMADLRLAIVTMPDGSKEEVEIDPTMGPQVYTENGHNHTWDLETFDVFDAGFRGAYGGAHRNAKWQELHVATQQVLTLSAAKKNRLFRDRFGEDVVNDAFAGVRERRQFEKMRGLKISLLEMLASSVVQDVLDRYRNACDSAVLFSIKMRAHVAKTVAPEYGKYGVDQDWLAAMLDTHGETQVIEQMNELVSFKSTVGPRHYEKGVLCEVQGLGTTPDSSVVIIRSWDRNRYKVSPWENLRESRLISESNLRLPPQKRFSSVEEAKAFQKALLELYGSSAAREEVAGLKSSHPKRPMYIDALRATLLRLQKPVLQRYGFRADALGQSHASRGLADFMQPWSDGDVAARNDELQQFGLPSEIRFDGRVVIVTGGGRGLGRSYSVLFASRGAKVVVNNRTKEKADEVVAEITANGGRAVPDYNDVAEGGDKITATALRHFGRVDIIIMNAGQLFDMVLMAMRLPHFTDILKTHVVGHMNLLAAAWPHLKKQQYGRILLTTSTSGLYGNRGQMNYAAAKHAIAALGQTIARDGLEYGIHANMIAPIAETRMTNALKPKALRLSDAELDQCAQPVAKSVAFLCHEECPTTGAMFFVQDGHIAPLRWESNEAFLPFNIWNGADAMDAVAASWPAIPNWSQKDYPGIDLTEGSPKHAVSQQKTEQPPQGAKQLRFDGRVAVVTCGGSGLGKEICKLLASRGAKVVVNGNLQGQVDQVVKEIIGAGGEAVADCNDSYDDAVTLAMDTYSRLDIVVAFHPEVEEQGFEQFGSTFISRMNTLFTLLKDAYPRFYDPKYGRIVLLSREVGLHGQAGLMTNAALNGSIMGISQTLAMEGYAINVFANCVCTDDETSSGAIAYLCHDSCYSSAGIYHVKGGRMRCMRLQQDDGFVDFDTDNDKALDEVAERWLEVPKRETVSYPGYDLHMSYQLPVLTKFSKVG